MPRGEEGVNYCSCCFNEFLVTEVGLGFLSLCRLLGSGIIVLGFSLGLVLPRCAAVSAQSIAMDDPIFGPHSPIPYVILESPIEISDEASSGPHLVLASPISDVCSETEIESSDEEKAQLIDGVYRFPSKAALAKITERAKQATMAVLREHYARAKPEVSSESNMCGQCTGRSLKVDPAPIYFKGGGGRPGIYFKAGGATTEGPGLDPQSTFTPHLLPLGIYFQRPAGTCLTRRRDKDEERQSDRETERQRETSQRCALFSAIGPAGSMHIRRVSTCLSIRNTCGPSSLVCILMASFPNLAEWP